MTKELLPISSARTAGQRLGLRSIIADECLSAVEYAVAVEDGKL